MRKVSHRSLTPKQKIVQLYHIENKITWRENDGDVRFVLHVDPQTSWNWIVLAHRNKTSRVKCRSIWTHYPDA